MVKLHSGEFCLKITSLFVIDTTASGVDQTKFDPATTVNLKNVNAQGFWESAMDAVTVDGTDTGLQGRTAILDTGQHLF